jgi:DNA-binding SARP family transcriptional activator
VDYEPAFEEAYRLSMQIYKRLGDRTSIMRIYQTCRDVLQRRLGMPPSEETEALYRSLIV